jgi:adenylate cyclase class 2
MNDTNKYQETEIKLYVSDLATVEARLQAEGAALKTPRVFERNVRYDDAAGGLSAARRVLRLREDERVRLTFKDEGAAQGDGPYSRFEAEVTVSEFAAMDMILGKLGFAPYMMYEKYRTTYALNGVEVLLDEMPYGHFVEIEGAEDAIMPAVERLGLVDAPRMTASYSALFERVRTALGLTFTDLTFANFAGITVPPSALGA